MLRGTIAVDATLSLPSCNSTADTIDNYLHYRYAAVVAPLAVNAVNIIAGAGPKTDKQKPSIARIGAPLGARAKVDMIARMAINVCCVCIRQLVATSLLLYLDSLHVYIVRRAGRPTVHRTHSTTRQTHVARCVSMDR
jgi:hypothetical protein